MQLSVLIFLDFKLFFIWFFLVVFAFVFHHFLNLHFLFCFFIIDRVMVIIKLRSMVDFLIVPFSLDFVLLLLIENFKVFAFRLYKRCFKIDLILLLLLWKRITINLIQRVLLLESFSMFFLFFQSFLFLVNSRN